MIHIYWSSMTCMQSSYYPHLFRALEALAASDNKVKVIDISLHSYKSITDSVTEASLIVVDHSIHMSYALSLPDRAPEWVYFVHKPRKTDFYKSVWDFLLGIKDTKKVLVYAGDLHAISKPPAQRADGLGDGYLNYLQAVDAIAWIYRPDSIPAIASLPEAYVETWMKSYKDSRQLAFDLRALISTAIELPLCVAQTELFNHPRQWRWDVAVPGAGYKTRLIALADIAEQGKARLAPYTKYIKWQDRLVSYLVGSRLFAEQAVARVKYRMGHFLQESIIRNTDVTYTCGGPLRYFVRKFYEVPAFGSLLLGDMPCYCADHGFIDGENYVQTQPEEVGRHLQILLKDEPLREKIRAGGQQLIKRLHTADKRAEQFIYALKTLVERPYREAKFISGTYTIVD